MTQELPQGMEELRSRETAAGVAAHGVAPGTLSRLLQELARGPQHLASAWDAALFPGARIGRFELVREVGRGGFGVVWEARDTVLGRGVAFKAVHATGAAVGSDDRLLLEADVAARLTHPNIVTLYDVGRSEHGPFLVMELLRGQTLAERLEQGPVAVPEAVRIAGDIAKGVAFAHGRGVFHRDLKPANAFLCDDGQVKILDFGLAHAFGAPSSSGGTPAFMAPEQSRGAPEDERTDVFALGVILYRLLANEMPFREDRGSAQHPHRARSLEVRGAPGLGELVARMLEPDPVRRPRDGREVAAALSSLQRELDRASSPEAPAPVCRKGSRLHGAWMPRSRGALLALSAAVLVALAAALLARSPGALERAGDAIGAARERVRPAALPEKKRLALLPFGVVAGNAADQALSAGLREMLTSWLGELERSGSVRVVSPKDVREEDGTPRAARAAFGATLALQVRTRWRSDGVTARLALVDTATGQVLRTRTVDATREALSSLPRLVAERTAEMLHVDDAPLRSSAPAGQARSPGAYEFYAQGRGYLQRYDRSENLDSAIAVFDRALALDPSYALAHAGTAEAYLRRYQQVASEPRFLAEARASARRAVELDDGLTAVQLTMGLVHVAAGEHAEAIRRFTRALELDPHSADVHRELANAYEAAGRLAEAEATYLRAIQLRPDSWAAYKDLAIFHYRRGRMAEALDGFKRVVELTPDNYGGYANLGGTYFALGNSAEALKVLEQGLALGPTAKAYANLATVQFYDRRYREAEEAYAKATELNPTEARWWGYRGDANRRLGRAAEAARDYRQAIALIEKQLAANPREAEPWGRLAMHQAALGEREKAFASIAEALRLRPKDGLSLFRAAIVYEEAGDRDRALAAVRDALAAGYSQQEIGKAPALEELRTDPRYAALAAAPRPTPLNPK
jgi:tetratricopeptide (TPR) repeat protein